MGAAEHLDVLAVDDDVLTAKQFDVIAVLVLAVDKNEDVGAAEHLDVLAVDDKVITAKAI